jgi:hypothetical protein
VFAAGENKRACAERPLPAVNRRAPVVISLVLAARSTAVSASRRTAGENTLPHGPRLFEEEAG